MTAKVITVANQKGGCGKTVTTMQLSGTLAIRGFKTLVVDMDPQNTATRWAGQDVDGTKFQASVSNLAAMKGNVRHELRKLLENYDFIVIDAPPSVDSPVSTVTMLISDLVIIPVVPAPADMWAMVAARDLALLAREQNETLQIRILANMVQNTSNLARDLGELLKEDPDVMAFTTTLGLRNAFRDCQLIGGTVHKVPHAKAARAEVNALTDEVMELLGVEEPA